MTVLSMGHPSFSRSIPMPATPATTPPPLRDAVTFAVQNYLQQLGDQPPSDVYELVLSEIETPLLEVMMKYVYNNQSEAAKLMGLSRGTLRKKLKKYGMLRSKDRNNG